MQWHALRWWRIPPGPQLPPLQSHPDARCAPGRRTPSHVPAPWPDQLLQHHAQGQALFAAARKQAHHHEHLRRRHAILSEQLTEKHAAELARLYDDALQKWHDVSAIQHASLDESMLPHTR